MGLKGACRACLETDRTMCPLVESIIPKFDSPPTSVMELWNIYAKLLISDEDRFPNKICNECLDEIQRSYFFIFKCKKSVDVLTNIKNVQMCSETLKPGSISCEYDSPKNIKKEHDLYPNILQVKTEISESNETDTGNFKANIHGNADSPVDSTLQNTLIVQHQDESFRIEMLDQEGNVDDATNNRAATIQDIKPEPELEISEENDEGYDFECEDKHSIEYFKCSGCSYESSMLECLKEHIIESHIEGQICKLCRKEFQCSPSEHCSTHQHANSTEGVLKSTNRRQYKCEICPKVFRQKFSLTVHLRCHTGERPFNCESCSKTFRYKSHLTAHLRCHTGKRPFKCELCPLTFVQKWHLTAHLRCHTGERPFKCEVCYKNFQHKHDLTRHFRCHTGERPFVCEICNKTFQQKNNLTTHLRCHTGERPFKCEICSKCFQQKDYLTRHLISHSGERPFKCDFCSKTFQVKQNLTRHLRSHTGERPYKCEVCSQAFGHKCDLTRHLIKHRAKDEKGNAIGGGKKAKKQSKVEIPTSVESQVEPSEVKEMENAGTLQ